MSERITAANLDEVIKRNEVIEEQMKQSASLIWSKYNPINQRKTTMIGHSTGRRITMKPLFPEKFLMQPIICGHPAIIQRKTDPCPC